MAGRRALRCGCGGSRNAFTAGNGHHPGATPGTWEEPGDRPSRGYLAPAGGARRRPGQATGQRARRGRAGPLHLIYGGALPDSARQERLRQGRHVGNAGMPAATIWGQDTARASPRAAAAGGSERGSRRAGNRPVQGRRTAGPQGWVPRRRASSVCPAGWDGRRSWSGRPEISVGACGNDSGPGQAACGDRGSCGQLPGRAPVGAADRLPVDRAGQGTGRQRDASASAVAGR